MTASKCRIYITAMLYAIGNDHFEQ
ncbi:hypothetical protein PPL_00601 [Heterostelium album PN500]|uniref:Uncharacterized protein n=1 Tax=Heterostelium pallidum (strain ATCC 26659 / Pp 5 / PN500) TaxID=670386 RepID=D3AWX3_HETP5|nr:hypothetical protein PPL_00601 [Heterostelium album PN500]